MTDLPGVSVNTDARRVPRRSLRRIVELHVDQALDEISADPGIMWDLSYAPQGEGADGSVVALLVLTCPSTVIGQYICIAGVVRPYLLTNYDKVLEMCRGLTETIRNLRTQALKGQ